MSCSAALSAVVTGELSRLRSVTKTIRLKIFVSSQIAGPNRQIDSQTPSARKRLIEIGLSIPFSAIFRQFVSVNSTLRAQSHIGLATHCNG